MHTQKNNVIYWLVVKNEARGSQEPHPVPPLGSGFSTLSLGVDSDFIKHKTAMHKKNQLYFHKGVTCCLQCHSLASFHKVIYWSSQALLRIGRELEAGTEVENGVDSILSQMDKHWCLITRVRKTAAAWSGGESWVVDTLGMRDAERSQGWGLVTKATAAHHLILKSRGLPLWAVPILVNRNYPWSLPSL